MEPKLVERTCTPSYPTRREVLAGAASFVLVGLTGHRFVFAEAGGSGELPSGETVVAPIFEHGQGHGSIGCSAVVPPAFLSEEEGMQILGEELAKHGVKLKPGRALGEVRVPARIEKDVEVDKGDGRKESVKEIAEDMDHAALLEPDGFDSENRIAVEFVTCEDVDLFTREDQSAAAENALVWSIRTYEFKDTAERIAAAAKKQGRSGIYLGVFYEPVKMKRPADLEARAEAGDAQPLMQWDAQHEGNMGECRDLLRKQARDFAAWLKKQGAIPS